MADEIIIETTSTEVVEVGTPGPQGPAGTNGTNGQGVPVGGTTGQVLRKASDANYDTEWATGGGGGVSSWNDLTDKPATFPPSSHTHPTSDITNFATAAAAAAPVQSVNGSTGAVTVTVPTASSSTPSALGVAAAGTSANFARADHVHAMPSAADVGAEPLGAVDSLISGDNVVDKARKLYDTASGSLAMSAPDLGDIENTPWFVAEPENFRDAIGLGTAATSASTDFAAASHTHADATTTVAGFLSASDKSKIDGIAANATANSSDSTLLNRANHTGTQAANTITGLAAIATSGSASDLTTGTVATARLGTGTADSTTFLRGDGAWAAPSGGVSAMQSIAINFVLN